MNMKEVVRIIIIVISFVSFQNLVWGDNSRERLLETANNIFDQNYDEKTEKEIEESCKKDFEQKYGSFDTISNRIKELENQRSAKEKESQYIIESIEWNKKKPLLSSNGIAINNKQSNASDDLKTRLETITALDKEKKEKENEIEKINTQIKQENSNLGPYYRCKSNKINELYKNAKTIAKRNDRRIDDSCIITIYKVCAKENDTNQKDPCKIVFKVGDKDCNPDNYDNEDCLTAIQDKLRNHAHLKRYRKRAGCTLDEMQIGGTQILLKTGEGVLGTLQAVQSAKSVENTSNALKQGLDAIKTGNEEMKKQLESSAKKFNQVGTANAAAVGVASFIAYKHGRLEKIAAQDSETHKNLKIQAMQLAMQAGMKASQSYLSAKIAKDKAKEYDQAVQAQQNNYYYNPNQLPGGAPQGTWNIDGGGGAGPIYNVSGAQDGGINPNLDSNQHDNNSNLPIPGDRGTDSNGGGLVNATPPADDTKVGSPSGGGGGGGGPSASLVGGGGDEGSQNQEEQGGDINLADGGKFSNTGQEGFMSAGSSDKNKRLDNTGDMSMMQALLEKLMPKEEEQKEHQEKSAILAFDKQGSLGRSLASEVQDDGSILGPNSNLFLRISTAMQTKRAQGFLK
jgi:hypothetical protein